MSENLNKMEMIRESHEVFVGDKHNHDIPKIRGRLLAEEAEEVREAIENLIVYHSVVPKGKSPKAEQYYLEHIAKELADLLYVTYGAAYALGIDIDRAFELVHQSNMSKLGEDGKPIVRRDGKVLKGPNYFEPDLSETICTKSLD